MSFLLGHIRRVEAVPRGGDQRQRTGRQRVRDREHGTVAVRNGARGAERGRRRVDALLLLPPIAEPHAHHLLLHAQGIRQHGDLLRRGLRVREERLLQGHPHARLNGRPLLPAPPDRLRGRHRVAQRTGVAQRVVRVLQPLLQQRLQFAHILKTQIQRLEP